MNFHSFKCDCLKGEGRKKIQNILQTFVRRCIKINSLNSIVQILHNMNAYTIQTFLVLVFLIHFSQPMYCPLHYQTGSVLSQRIIILHQRSFVKFKQSSQSQCFRYPLTFPFSEPPSVAVSIREFAALPTDHLYITVKPKRTKSDTHLDMLMKHPWRYTRWTRLVINLFVENRKDIQSGYYQIDTGNLADCHAEKYINVFLPFREIRNGTGASHQLFLNGFDISTQQYQVPNSEAVAYSPFDIQITNSTSKYAGMNVFFSVTTITEIYNLFVSYIAWSQTSLSIAAQTLIFDRTDINQELIRLEPGVGVGRNYARIVGISGFIINNSEQNMYFSSDWLGSYFAMELKESQRLVQYLSLSYLFVRGGPCQNCPGYSFHANGTCVQFCPPGSFPSQLSTCVFCGEDFYWNGFICVRGLAPLDGPILNPAFNTQPQQNNNNVLLNLADNVGAFGENTTLPPPPPPPPIDSRTYICPGGRIYDQIYNTCSCPEGLHWNGKQCLNCDKGTVFNEKSKACRCPKGKRWNGIQCQDDAKCKDGKEWNVFQFTCQCPTGTFWNGTFCERKISCQNGQVSDGKNGCVCPENTHWNNQWCEFNNCVGGQIWNGTGCQCNEGEHFNGTICLLCINGQEWNETNKKCECPLDSSWDGNICKKVVHCSGMRIWNELYNQCLCPENKYWNGYICMIQPPCCCGRVWNAIKMRCQCPESFNWDGTKCVLCIDGKRWNNQTSQCDCAEGTKWNGKFCVVIQECFGGMVWIQNTWSCECPSSYVFNGNYCIANPCQGGQVWNNQARKCECVGGKVYTNRTCIPPQVICKGGRIWDPRTYSCKCPPGKWDNGKQCEDIPSCENNQLYNSYTNECMCGKGLVWLQGKKSCVDPSCPNGQMWDGHGCVAISCPPNSYFNGTQCIYPNPQDRCQPWEYFDGKECIYFPDQCPEGMNWNGSLCVPDVNACPVGFYKVRGQCTPLPQRCIPPSYWEGSRCNPGTDCPPQTYMRNGKCYSYKPCQNGQSWDEQLIQCVCPEGTEWNNDRCIHCSGGKIWQPFAGCECPTGYFFAGSRCQKITQTKCSTISNTVWDGQQCLCHQGFSSVGLQCVCKGVQIRNLCERCAHKPNSQWKYGKCRCKQGFTDYGNECLGNQEGADTKDSCNVGTFFDSQQKRCLPCPEGCLSCINSYQCSQCRPQFKYDRWSELCIESCGDGKKFIVECDDGNNDNGDGCTEDCKVERGYSCIGGSPNHPDNCIMYRPDKVTIVQTGQIRYERKIIINVKIDYMPKKLLQSEACLNECGNVLGVQVTRGSDKPLSIRSKYIAGSSYTFSVEIEFGRSYISLFSVRIQLQQELNKFYEGVNISEDLTVEVNPAILSLAEGEHALK